MHFQDVHELHEYKQSYLEARNNLADDQSSSREELELSCHCMPNIRKYSIEPVDECGYKLYVS